MTDWIYDFEVDEVYPLPRNRSKMKVVHDATQWEPGMIYMPRSFLVVRATTLYGARQKVDEFLEGTWRKTPMLV